MPNIFYKKEILFTGHAFPAKWNRAKSVFESFGFSSLGCALKFWNNFIAKVSCVDFPSMLFNKTRKKSECWTQKCLITQHEKPYHASSNSETMPIGFCKTKHK